MMLSMDRALQNPHEELLMKVDSSFKAEMEERRKCLLKKRIGLFFLFFLVVFLLFAQYKGVIYFSKMRMLSSRHMQSRHLRSDFLPGHLTISTQPFLIPCKVTSVPETSLVETPFPDANKRSEESK
jgi:hypothetical protein